MGLLKKILLIYINIKVFLFSFLDCYYYPLYHCTFGVFFGLKKGVLEDTYFIKFHVFVLQTVIVVFLTELKGSPKSSSIELPPSLNETPLARHKKATRRRRFRNRQMLAPSKFVHSFPSSYCSP
jgi:hypothetical protein